MSTGAGQNQQTALVAALRTWIRGHDPHVRAAVELLIEHDVWLRHPDFTRACIVRSGGEAYVNWVAARAFSDAGAVASTSEMAILDLAVALGENRYRLSIMGETHSRWIATAVARAVGVAR
jgi:hypothetical protein